MTDLIGKILATGMMGLIIILVLIVGLTWLYSWLKNKTQGYPQEVAIETFLLPKIYLAICAAYKTSENASLDLGQKLQGLDKKRIADGVYDLLPLCVTIGGVEVPLKQFVTREQFATKVEWVFKEFLLFYQDNAGHFQQEMEKWIAANEETESQASRSGG